MIKTARKFYFFGDLNIILRLNKKRGRKKILLIPEMKSMRKLIHVICSH